MRKLAAIMFTDIVGYTALMGQDEEKALQLLHRNRALLKPIIEQFHGEWLKELGDGTLSSFASAVEAVNCALEIQHIFQSDPELNLRIGIHIGDVVFEEGDIFGDGVNVASRIVPLAEPGCICVSERVYDDIRNKPGIETTSLGEKTLKGVDHPIKVFAVTEIRAPLAEVLPITPRLTRLRWRAWAPFVIVLSALAIAVAVRSWWGRSRDPLAAFEHTVAVMPFNNLTGDESFDIWEKGMAMLLITDLSTSEELYVLDSQTLFDVINAIESVRTAQVIPALAREVATRTQVKNVILGDILQAGDQLRLQARLLEVKTGEVTFSHFVIGKNEDNFFSMTQTLSDRIKDHLEIRVLQEEAELDLQDAMTTSAAALRHFIQGMDAHWRSDFPAAIAAFTRAIEIDTMYVGAYLFMAISKFSLRQFEAARNTFYKADRLKKRLPPADLAFLEAGRALFIDKDPYAEIHWLKKYLDIRPLSRVFWYQLGREYYTIEQHARAIEALERALALSDQWGSGWQWLSVYSILGSAYHELGRHERELEVYEKGLSVLPDHPYLLATLAAEFIFLGDSVQADAYLTRFKATNDERGRSQVSRLSGLGDVYRRASDVEQAQRLWRQALAIDPQQSTVLFRLAYLLIDHDINVNEGLELIERALELQPNNPDFLDTQGWGYYQQGRYTEAVEVLEQAWQLIPYYSHGIYQHLEAARKAVAEQKQ